MQGIIQIYGGAPWQTSQGPGKPGSPCQNLREEKMMKRFDQLLMWYLRKRGWIVFWLDENVGCDNDQCWLELYRNEQKRK